MWNTISTLLGGAPNPAFTVQDERANGRPPAPRRGAECEGIARSGSTPSRHAASGRPTRAPCSALLSLSRKSRRRLNGKSEGSPYEAVHVEDDFNARPEAAPGEKLGGQREHQKDYNEAESPHGFAPSREGVMHGESEKKQQLPGYEPSKRR